MKITDAWIDDPTLLGEIAVPELCVQVDERPDVTIVPESFSNGWKVGKYGPFVKYTGPDNKTVSAVDFNLAFRDRLPMVIDIVLVVVSDDTDIPEAELRFSLPLERARQLVKKYDPEWRLLVSDRDAVHGNLFWRPVQSNPACRSKKEGEAPCGIRPAGLVRMKGVDVPLCAKHTQEHNTAYAKARASSSK